MHSPAFEPGWYKWVDFLASKCYTLDSSPKGMKGAKEDVG